MSSSTFNTIWYRHNLALYLVKRLKLSRDPWFSETLPDPVNPLIMYQIG